MLTLKAYRRGTPKRNRRIPTIPAGRTDVGPANVSAVDTGPRGSESAGFLVAQPGAAAVWNHRHSCLRPCVICRTQPPPPGGPSPFVGRAADRPRPSPATWVPSHVTNVMTSNIELYLAPTRRPASHGSTPTPPAPSRLRPESARVGLLHEGRDLLATGCAYCTRAPPTRSTPNPPPVAPHPRAVHPDDTGQPPQSPGRPPPLPLPR